MIKKFSCKNFRNVNINSIEFERINILIGPNNSGKTNFIKAISFFANMMMAGRDNEHKSAFLNEVAKNGWGSLLNKDAHSKQVEFSWLIELADELMKFDFSFNTGLSREDFFITKESLDSADKPSYQQKPFNYFSCHEEGAGTGRISTATKKGQPNQRKQVKISSADSILMQFRDVLLENKTLYNDVLVRQSTAPILEKMQEYFKSFCAYSSAQFDLNKIKQPADVKMNGTVLLSDASNFVSVFNYYKNSDIFFKNTFEKRLRELMPDLTLTDIAVEFEKLVFRLGYDRKQFNLSEISDGTLKALILTMLINLPINNGLSLLAIDEPEMNLHPAWQKLIAKWIVLSNNYKQCFISTHSPDFLDVFTDNFLSGDVGVFVFDPKQENIVQKLNKDKVKNALEGWQMGDLYRVNDPSIGGWPW